MRTVAHNATVVHSYTFANGEAANGAYAVMVTDRADNETVVSFSVLQDYVPPTAVFTVAERITTTTIPLQWSAVEDGSGVQYYDVEYQVNDGDWVRWFTATTQTQATFAGELGKAYTFRVRATDNVRTTVRRNASDWAQVEARTVVVKKYYSVPSAGSGQAAGQRMGAVVPWGRCSRPRLGDKVCANRRCLLMPMYTSALNRPRGRGLSLPQTPRAPRTVINLTYSCKEGMILAKGDGESNGNVQ